ncbi:MAG: peptide-methionine (S)-S-oxide reductase MsrA [Alphaproteobacteria bacterium]|nr:peptide-methionine (S)-S-oxide reductase MsrA [Alphaproteobacteria bacterium]
MKRIFPVLVLVALVFGLCSIVRPKPVHAAVPDKTEMIVVAGGCFWGVEAIYDHLKGVTKATSGYAGGGADTAHYDRVSDGDTGHAESVQITYDPSQVTLEQLLDVYFKVAHDPTELNHQGPDQGTQYRSEVFVTKPEQEKIVKEKIAALTAARTYHEPIVTKVEMLKAFYPAEDYHQNYLATHLSNPYIVMHDLPKLAKLRVSYPELYKD